MRGSPIIRSDDLRSENRRRLLETLRSFGACAPAKLRDLTGLSAASVSTLSTQLIDQGIIKSEKDPESVRKTGRGRPKTLLSLNSKAGFTITVNITIDHIEVQCVKYDGKVCESRSISTDTRALSEDDLLYRIMEAVDELCAKQTTNRLLHIGVAFQGVTEHATGRLLWSPILQLQNVPLGESLGSRYNTSVSVENDCQLMSEALSQKKPKELGQSFATVLFSHGIGLGLFLGGRPFSGIRSSALELGHMRFERNGALCRCGKLGCIEAYAANYGIERLAFGHSISDVPVGRVSSETLNELVDQAVNGDKAVSQAFVIAGAAVAEGLVNLFTLFDAMPVALIGHDDCTFSLMQEGIESVFRQNLDDEKSASSLIHYFNNEKELLEFGLIHNSLRNVDELFSDPGFESHIAS
ncbi:MAG: ROK family protein [Granulosicoccus sp.]